MFRAHQRGDVERHLARQRAGQLFQLRVALSLVVLTKPGRALHERDEQCETEQYNDCTMQPKFQFCASHIPPAENLRLNVARSDGYKVASCVIFRGAVTGLNDLQEL